MASYTPLRLSYHRRGSSDDKHHRTAGMVARADPPLERMRVPVFPRLVRRLRRMTGR